MIVEHVDFWALPVTDVERAKEFYGGTLGLEEIDHPEQGFPEYKLGDNGFLYLLNMESIGSSFQGPHTAGFALRVPDVAEAKAELEAKGVEFAGMLDSGVCHMAFFADPDGNQIVLHRRYAPRS
jgi:catechol 2,3-dioxygenase-like lactoylglutathione lyase family enzyme